MRISKRAAIGVVLLFRLGQCETALAQLSPAPSPPAEPYTWHNVVIGGGGFVTGLILHPAQKDLMYARTDVGGAYRWDESAQRWIPLLDCLGEADFTGIESLALDPADTNFVCLAAGIYQHTRAAIFRSTDQGRSWQRTEVPFKMGGNETGRFNGERLAVDPNDGNLLFFGSRHDGLWKSTDRGATWNEIPGFPRNDAPIATPPTTPTHTGRRFRFNFPPQQTGIVFVRFDSRSGPPGKPTPVIYAGVSAATNNFFRSDDGGNTWPAVPGQPAGLRPNHAVLSPDGLIYLTYGKEPGPNVMTDGAVWKFNPRDSQWTDITPLKSPDAATGQLFGYGAVAVDATHPATVMVTTFCHWKPLDEIFRSTNGGASWMPLMPKARWDHSSAPYTRAHKPHWMGDIEINPFNPDQALFTTGYGIWCCTNVTAADRGKSTQWVFLDQGLEETVPLALLSPPAGAHLLSGVGDIDGFRHDDLNLSPARGSFAGPRFSNTEDLALAGGKPNVVVRTGTGQNGDVRAAISTDGGKNWQALGSEPPDSEGAGAIAVAADGKTIVWTPRRSAPHFSLNRGKTWAACAGLAPGIRVVADPVNPLRFYAFDPRAGRLLASTNGAAAFAATAAALPPEEATSGWFGFNGATLSPTPDREGDLWLALQTHGLYYSTNAGATFTKLECVREAGSLGFGKPVPGRNSPALFLSGQIGLVHGLFRSDDTGATWTRINDDQHQFGTISHVTGDPRIYGRVYFATGGRGIIYGDPTPTPAQAQTGL